MRIELFGTRIEMIRLSYNLVNLVGDSRDYFSREWGLSAGISRIAALPFTLILLTTADLYYSACDPHATPRRSAYYGAWTGGMMGVAGYLIGVECLALGIGYGAATGAGLGLGVERVMHSRLGRLLGHK
ncbi:hypothetical protein HYS91_03875 [Candidatus Daviesbacteria bacterium]|nr:hypothetical protein [Candidatus Daviesbacteria bacterium]